ncbi:uncharacterized conserved protein [Pelotomaculum thermopropionicum SI]|uniref:Uncharacterized conserved protein n=1 Tax=Pelotomaculum thermopropionicum (strain DSM 13744 / JCM 10971 / SI) TaxID=370438 RepID=A5D486_PELTS|nr:uncharacterized conserved protein [Pelotomaculum thermopropionicum SI]
MFYIGTAGYSYQDWVGTVYPAGTKKEDMLKLYAGEFNFSEINSTYYHLPGRRMTEALAAKTPPGFRFAVKAFQQMTHARDGGPEVFRRFAEALRPLAGSGRLACVLAQFPYSFHNTPENRDYLKKFRHLLPDLPVAVEFRNARWVAGETFELLREEGLAYVCVDEPALKGLVRAVAVVTAPFAYVRFHGRNAARWYDHKESYQRYDYLYTADELKEWLPRVAALREKAGEVYISFNNHYRGQAVANARMFRDMIGTAGII